MCNRKLVPLCVTSNAVSKSPDYDILTVSGYDPGHWLLLNFKNFLFQGRSSDVDKVLATTQSVLPSNSVFTFFYIFFSISIFSKLTIVKWAL